MTRLSSKEAKWLIQDNTDSLGRTKIHTGLPIFVFILPYKTSKLRLSHLSKLINDTTNTKIICYYKICQ